MAQPKGAIDRAQDGLVVSGQREEKDQMSHLWLSLACVAVMGICAVVQKPDRQPERHILSYKQYATIPHKTPYVLAFGTRSGALLIYGAEHTGNPKDPQITDIQHRWSAFHPTVAYNEGGNPPTLEELGSAVQNYGEPGLLRFLAGRDQVPVATFEPSFDQEIASLRKLYTPEQLKIFYALRQVTEARLLQSSTPIDDRIREWLADYLPAHGLKNAPNDLTEFTAACKRLFPDLSDWHQVSSDWFDPTQSLQYTNRLAGDSGMFRDRHIFSVLAARVKRGDRVFAVIGEAHVVVMEPALALQFGQPTLKVNGLR